MRGSTRIIVLGAVLLLAGLAVGAQFVSVREAGWQHQAYTANTGELTQQALVGQTFVAERDNLSGVAVQFATYSGRTNTQTVQLHLRASTTDSTDIRTATVEPAVLGDNQLYRFNFEPITDSGGKAFFFFVTSPGSGVGDAVTVDIDTRDPYHLGTAYIVRGEVVNTLDDPRVLARSGKQTVDLAFGLYYTVSLREAAMHQAQDGWRWFLATWDERQSLYGLWIKLALPALIFISLLWWVGGEGRARVLATRRGQIVVVGGLVLLAVVWRLLYAVELPVTNDEGNYLYDARTLLEGHLAGGDGYVKAPLVIAWIALWELMVGTTILAGRLSSIIAGALTVIPLYVLGRYMWNERTGVLTGAVWALFGAPAIFTVYVHTQPVALFWGISGLAVLWWALRTTPQRSEVLAIRQRPWFWFVVAGILLGLGVASRKSILALGLVPLLLIGIESGTWRERWERLVAVGVGFVAVLVLFLGFAIAMYGCESPLWLVTGSGRCMAVEEALGINSAEDGLTAIVDPSELEQVRAYSLRGMTPFFRESLPLILLAVIGWGISLERFGRRLLRETLTTAPRSFWLDQVVPKVMWAAAWTVFAWAWWFFWEYEGGVFVVIGGMQWLWWFMGLVLAVAMIAPRRYEDRFVFDEADVVSPTVQSRQPQFQVERAVQEKVGPDIVEPWGAWPVYISGVFVPLLWIGGLWFFYANWIKFHANYIGEFLPPLAVMSGVGAYLVWRRLQVRGLAYTRPMLDVTRQVATVLLVLVIGWTIYLSNYITYTFEHTGTFAQGSVAEAAAWARQHIPLEQPIFTGAALIPYLSGHHTALDIAHPRWYAYEFTRKDPARLNTFLPRAEDMVAAFRVAEWVLLEQQTSFSFLMEYSEIESGLERDFERVQSIENGSNTLTFYRRVRR